MTPQTPNAPRPVQPQDPPHAAQNTESHTGTHQGPSPDRPLTPNAAARKRYKTRKRHASGDGRATGPKHAPWTTIRELYVTSETHIRMEDLAIEFHLNADTVKKRAIREKWTTKRREFLQKTAEEFESIVALDQAASKARNLRLIRAIKGIVVNRINAGAFREPGVRDFLDLIKAEFTTLGAPDLTIQGTQDEAQLEAAIQAALDSGTLNRDAFRAAIAPKPLKGSRP